MKNFGKTMQILFFVLVGFVLGGVLSYFTLTNLFDITIKRNHTYIEADWFKVQYYGNQVTDQLIKFRKMLSDDKVKFDIEPITAAIDARAMMLGAADIDEKAKQLETMEKNISAVIDEYNRRLDLRNMRFGYIEWGLVIKQYIEEYNEHKERYIEAAEEFNSLIEKFPFDMTAKKLGVKAVPIVGHSSLHYVSKKTEPYHKDNIYRIDKYEGSSSAGSY